MLLSVFVSDTWLTLFPFFTFEERRKEEKKRRKEKEEKRFE
jgi:hypothetical protein